MLCLVAALAVPRTPDAHAALAEPEAGDTHELERGWGTACKDRIKDDMSIWDAMAACAKAKKWGTTFSWAVTRSSTRKRS